MSFEVFMQVWCLQKSKLLWKQRQTGEKSQNRAIRTTPFRLLLDTFLEHFLELKLCIPYIFLKIRKSGVQCFKRCAIWIWNEKVMTIWKNPKFQEDGWIVLMRNFRITPPLVRNFRITLPLWKIFNFFIPTLPKSQAFEPCPQLLKVGPTHHFCKYLV